MALTKVQTNAIADDAVTTDKLANAINTERTANTAKVSLEDNAVTLAKMAGGTDGQIITYDANGDPIAVGPGTDGQVLTSTGAGSPPAFETLPTSGATLSGSTDNTVVTVTGSNAMAGEANLTFDGNNLVQSIDAGGEGIKISAAGDHYPVFTFDADRSGAGANCGQFDFKWDGTGVARIAATTGSDTTNKDDGRIIFSTAAAGTLAEAVRIDTEGKVGIGTNGPSSLVHIKKDTGSGAAGTKVVIENGSTNSVNNNVELYLKTDAGDFGFKHYNATESYVQVPDQLIINTNTAASATQAVHIDTSQNVKVSTGNLVIGTSGKGISFAATSDSSVGSNVAELFDDYEEGTFGALAGASMTSATISYGTYTKIGRMVHVTYKATDFVVANSGSAFYLTLPFPVDSSYNDSVGSVMMQYFDTDQRPVMSYGYSSLLMVYQVNDDTNWTSMDGGDFNQGGTTTLLISHSYISAN